MRSLFEAKELQELQLAEPFSFTKGCRTLKIKTGGPYPKSPEYGRTSLFDVQNDPKQVSPMNDPAIEKRMIGHLKNWMKRCDAPAEQYERLGVS